MSKSITIYSKSYSKLKVKTTIWSFKMAHKMTHIVHKFESLLTKRTDKIPNQAETKLKLLRCTFTSNSSLDLIVYAVYISLVVFTVICIASAISDDLSFSDKIKPAKK